MNLSKVYTSETDFEPEDLISGRVESEAVFGSIITAKLPADHIFKPTPPRPQTQAQPEPKTEPEPEPQQEQKTLNEFVPPDQSVPEPPPEQPEAIVPPTQQTKPEPPRPPISQPDIPVNPEPAIPPTPPLPQGIPVEEVEQLVAESYDKGLQEGLEQAEEDFGTATKTVLNICQQLDSIRETILRNSVGEMQSLVLAIAEKIIRKSVEDQTDTVLRTVEDAIHKAVKSDELYVYVNPDDFDIVEKKSTELVTTLSGLNNLMIKRDPSIERGGCRVESDNCTVDATILSQLEIISDQLKQQE